jgi:membrane protein
VLVLLGAVVAAYSPSLQMRSVRRASGPGHRFELAVSLLGALANVQKTADHGLNVQQLSMALRVDPLQLEPLLETLLNIDWVARLDEGDTPRYVLLCEPATALAQPLFKATLLTRSTSVNGFWRSAGFDSMTLQDLIKD